MTRQLRRLRPSPRAAAAMGAARPVLPAAGVLAAAGLPLLAGPYTVHTTARLLAIGLLAVSVAVLTGHAGLPTLGQVASYAVGAYTTGLLATAGHTTALVQLAASAVAAAVFSVVTGVVVTRTRGVVFLMVTLAVGQLTAITVAQQKTVTGGTDGLVAIPATTLTPGGPPLVDAAYLYWYTLTVTGLSVLAVWWLLRRMPAGMLLHAARDNETRLRAHGHHVNLYLLAAYTAAGTLAGVAGSLLVTVQRYVSPADVGFHLAALMLLTVVIAGTRSLTATLITAAVVMAVRDWAANTLPGHGPLLLGLLFITAAYLKTRALAGGGPGRTSPPTSGRAATTPTVHLKEPAP